MKRKSVIVLENTNPKAFDEKIECFGNFKKMCLEKEFPYHSLKMFKFPITYKDSVIYKVEFKQQVTLSRLYGQCGKINRITPYKNYNPSAK